SIGERESDFHHAIVEVDRTTAPIRVAARLRAYGEIRRNRKLWERVFPSWPTILFVVSADSQPPKVGQRHWAGDRERSRAKAVRLANYVGKLAPSVPGLQALGLLFAPPPSLSDSGPHAAIWRRPGHPESLDWLGHPVMMLERGGAA